MLAILVLPFGIDEQYLFSSVVSRHSSCNQRENSEDGIDHLGKNSKWRISGDWQKLLWQGSGRARTFSFAHRGIYGIQEDVST